MIRNLIIALIVCGSAASGQAGQERPAPLARWSFDALEASGVAQSAEHPFRFVEGVLGKALLFDGHFTEMSDKQCRYSHVRIIENSPARAVIHWRYALTSITYKIFNETATYPGDWADEYWTVYPDGVVARNAQAFDKPSSTSLAYPLQP